ncbi:MAG TPA: glycosyltransferase [Mycobacteriales bacterium]|nr:glycosyltransferase [Mycobacteriales bacterium]
MTRIERVAVVVPARNEEECLPACLDAIERAAAVVSMPVVVVVGLDGCSDGTAAVVATRCWAVGLPLEVSAVGAARADATECALDLIGGVPLDRVWIATTDADSVVPANWLSGQLALADAGADVVVGTVAVDDWSEHSRWTKARWHASYLAVDDHPHVHGANLGVRASAYSAVGGWPRVTAHEDVMLVDALRDWQIVRPSHLAVVTSARRDPRAAIGFGDTLRAMAATSGMPATAAL